MPVQMLSWFRALLNLASWKNVEGKADAASRNTALLAQSKAQKCKPQSFSSLFWLPCLLSCLLICAVTQVRANSLGTAFTVPVAPWTFPDQPSRGLASEYLRFLFADAKVPMQFDTLPYVRVIHGLRDGSNSAAMLIPDAERDTFALRLCEVTTIRSGLLYKKSRFKNLSEADLKGLTVGIHRGTHALDKLEKSRTIQPYIIGSIEQGLKMLQLDRLDATFISSPGSDSVVRDSGLRTDDYAWLEIDSAPVVIYISRKAALAFDEAALQRLRTSCAGNAKKKMVELMVKYH